MNKFLLFLLLLMTFQLQAQTTFQVPPKEILELADTKSPANNVISRNNKFLAMLERPLYKSIEELAETELKLAGLRINPENFSPSRSTFFTSLKIQTINPLKEITITGLPENLKIVNFTFSPKENYASFVFYQTYKLGLWVIDLNTGVAKEVLNSGLNASIGGTYQWLDDESAIVCKYKGSKQKLDFVRELPKGPATQDATGEKAPARTFQDLLKNKQDEIKFDYYAKSEIVKVFLDGKQMEKLLPEGIYKKVLFSPDLKLILTEELKQPYSYTLTYGSFPSQFNIYDHTGKFIKSFYDRPLQDKVGISFDAVESGKRNIFWRPDMPSTLIWCEAMDGGDPAKEVVNRDQLFQSSAPFTQSSSLCLLKNRFSGISFGRNDLAIVEDFWYKNRNTKSYFIDPSKSNDNPTIIFDRSSEDLYSEPGDFQSTFNEYNRQVLQFSKDGKKLFLVGEGYSPEGNRPFFDEFDIASKKTNRIWRAEGKETYEYIVRVLDFNKYQLLTSIESPKTYPNLYIRDLVKKIAPRQITFKENPYKSLENITKKKIEYKRKDGVQLSATMYLPAGYDKTKDGRLPMLMDAYPTEYKDDKAAGQVKESPYTFVGINWASSLFWVTRGYCILEDAQFPIIGKGKEEPNDTYIEQLVADAEAAIQYVDSIGVVDKSKCAVMGHSYGAFMTANLLAHSSLFAAGIARSGAYNRSLTPFGFQSEERSYWQAMDVYNKMSPFNYADQFKSPLLMIHGDADNNPGTFTLQSERLFQAIKGNGGKARLVLLPFESHGYAARENILHMLWEMDTWLDKYVKRDKK